MKTAFQHDSSRTSRTKWVHCERMWGGSLRSLAGSQSVLVLALLFGAPGVARAAVVSVTLSPATITGGSGGLSTGTVTVSVPAPAGGPIGGTLGDLYQCQFPAPGVNNTVSICTFLQECAFGCLTTSSPTARNLNRQDVCVTTPPFPVAVNPEIVEGGRRSAGTVFLDAPAPPLASANVNSGFIGNISPAGFFSIPQGATTAPFDADTLEVAVPAIVPVRVSLFSQGERHAQDYLAVGPFAGSGPPSGPLAAFLVDLRTRAVVQG